MMILQERVRIWNRKRKERSMVVYYNQNSWNFTRMGHINDISQEELKEILGTGNVTMVFELMEE